MRVISSLIFCRKPLFHSIGIFGRSDLTGNFVISNHLINLRMARFGADMMQAAKPILMLWIWGSLLVTSFPTIVSAVGEGHLKWSEDLVATMKLAQQTGKPVLVHFYGDDCPPCRMLEKRAFKDPQLIESIHSNLLAVRINAQRDTKTAAKFRVNRWPTDAERPYYATGPCLVNTDGVFILLADKCLPLAQSTVQTRLPPSEECKSPQQPASSNRLWAPR